VSRKLVDGTQPKPKSKAALDRMHKGRPNKMEIDPDVIKRIRNAILMGAPVITAAALNDISYDTIRAWVLKGKEDPNSEYGALLKVIVKAVAEWEIRDLSTWDHHITGRPAQYLMQPMIDKKGQPIVDKEGKQLMEYVRDAEGNPILQASEIRSDWRAAMERMARRKPRTWATKLNVDLDAVLTFDNKEKEANPKEALSFEQRIALAVKELEDEV
jgi:DNA-binding transcriptional regulator YiaG